MRRRGLDRVVIGSTPNLTYLTGFSELFDEGFDGLAIVAREAAVLVTDGRYAEQAEAEAAGTEWEVAVVRSGAVSDAARRLRRGAQDRVGVEATLSHGTFVALAKGLGREPVAVRGLVERLRRTKTAAELDAIGRAARITDSAFDKVLGVLRPGLTEREVAFRIETAMRRSGASGVAFAPIVASGPNGSKPHARAGDRALAVDDLVVIDMGARVDGYCADMTRTVCLGRAGRAERAAYSAVAEAQEAALEAVAPGVRGRDLHAAARRRLAAHGLADRFLHGIGHGVGLEVHELPLLGRSGQALKAGDVITVEPGVYVRGAFGVRIEDTVVLAASGVQNLSNASKRLIEL